MVLLAFSVFTLAYFLAFVGVIWPILPGIPLALAGTFIAAWLIGFQQFGVIPLILVSLLALISGLIDYFAGIIGAKQYGASRMGVWGSIIGSLLGIFVFPPFGFLIGALLGAIVAEMLAGRELESALRSGLGVFVGIVGGIISKLFILVAIGIVVFPRLF